MLRIPEPELMDHPDQARAYAEADFSEPHGMFVWIFRETFGDALRGYVLDLGCGPADVTLRFARAYPYCHLHGVDGAMNMLALARRAALHAGLTERLTLLHGRLPEMALPRAKYDIILSNSLLHHLADPLVLWKTVKRYARPAAPILIMDLLRPDSEAQLEALVGNYAGSAPPILRQDFRHSLRAAYEVEEVRAQLMEEDLDYLQVRVVSDRHLIVSGRIQRREVTADR
jgi:ubiquinone/menaquinone biosynthesis C-methylase UbiE